MADTVDNTISMVRSAADLILKDPEKYKDVLDASEKAAKKTVDLISAIRGGKKSEVDAQLTIWGDVNRTLAAASKVKAASEKADSFNWEKGLDVLLGVAKVGFEIYRMQS